MLSSEGLNAHKFLQGAAWSMVSVMTVAVTLGAAAKKWQLLVPLAGNYSCDSNISLDRTLPLSSLSLWRNSVHFVFSLAAITLLGARSKHLCAASFACYRTSAVPHPVARGLRWRLGLLHLAVALLCSLK